MTVTLKDVAARAGVTTMTLSRFFRVPGKVAPTTRAAIETAIAEMGYVRDASAARLSGRAETGLALIVPDVTHPYAAAVMRGVLDVAEEGGLAVAVHETGFDLARQLARLRDALSWRPRGIVHLAGPLTVQERRMIDAQSVVVVEAWGGAVAPDLPHVGVPEAGAARMAARALLGAGYGRIGFALRRQGYPIEEARRVGYLEAMEEGGAAPIVFEREEAGDSFDVGARLLGDAAGRVDALLMAGDFLAIGALGEAARRGLSVPGSLAICGMGGYPMSAHTVPALSTVAIPHREIGADAARRCLDPGAARPARAARLIERRSARLAS